MLFSLTFEALLNETSIPPHQIPAFSRNVNIYRFRTGIKETAFFRSDPEALSE